MNSTTEEPIPIGGLAEDSRRSEGWAEARWDSTASHSGGSPWLAHFLRDQLAGLERSVRFHFAASTSSIETNGANACASFEKREDVLT